MGTLLGLTYALYLVWRRYTEGHHILARQNHPGGARNFHMTQELACLRNLANNRLA